MLIRIGTNTYIPGEEIYYVTDYTSNSTVNMVRKAKEEKRVIDATRGKAIGSVMFMRANNMVVPSNISVDTIIKNMKKTK